MAPDHTTTTTATAAAAAAAAVPIPERLVPRPRDDHGRVIPWFVSYIDGRPDFRVANQARLIEALRFRKCWMCGGQLGRYVAFLIGPMCAVNRVTAEPGNHLTCAIYAARVCPFLTTPAMRRRTTGLTADKGLAAPPGIGLARNPGVALIWVTQRWKIVRTGQGPLISLGDPTQTLWFARGQPATPGQARTAFDAAVPILYAAAELDDDPAASRAHIDAQIAAAHRLLPDALLPAPAAESPAADSPQGQT